MTAIDLQAKAKQLVKVRCEAGISRAIADSFIIGQRNLIRLSRQPAVITGVLVFPIVFLTAFLLAFERSMSAQNIDYIQYLVPIITLQAMFFTAMNSASNLAGDIDTGMLQRCRAMPISRAAVLGGLLIAYLVRAIVTIAILLPVAYLYGFRFQAGVLSAIGYILLTLFFTTVAVTGYSLLALGLKKPDLVQSLVIVPYAPFLLLSSGFSPAENFPNWLQPFVIAQPVSHIAAALRALASGEPLLLPLLWSIGWLIVLLFGFGFTAIWLYRRIS
ncbi:ABC transporter permease [Leptolyngbya sp. FACHB-541]|uniref:ABC transporter permease n=1 Tax=Leptolyngbya sp. FACHB-541 TaxID=2692810 RepID=UPI001687C987|nr:ABC transporter permease [Leptolyngbya sp. FACHB-541]MBD2000320.1 ABC transporter permease [Leptolyngbya sp. FACHB-541]